MSMAITLNNLEQVDAEIQAEHQAWVKQNAPKTIDISQLKAEQFHILKHPELWSGARLFETSVKKAAGDLNPAYDDIKDTIKETRSTLKKDSPELKELNAFAKNYKKYKDFIRQRCLLKAIYKTLNDIEDNEHTRELKEEFSKLLNASSLLSLQTRIDCLQKHKQVATLCYALKDRSSEPDKAKQLEVLSKRLLDCHYEGAKKVTFTEGLAKDVSTLTSFVGLLTGVPAAILGIAGIFFPPLLVPAGILGLISFVSYTSSAISAVNMAQEAIKYGRGPSPSDVKWLVIDTVLAPFNFVGGTIFSGISHAVRPLKHLHHIVKNIGFIWNNVISNVFPDTVDTKEVSTDMLDVGTVLTKSGELKNTTTASSMHQVKMALAVDDHEAHAKINSLKEKITTLPEKTAIHGRDFAYVQYSQNNKESKEDVPIAKSYHGHILLWDAGFMGTSTSQEAKQINDAVAAYKALPPDSALQKRVEVLKSVMSNAKHYLQTYEDDDSKGRYKYVEKLVQHCDKEIHSLQRLNASAQHEEPVVLIGFKAH